MKKWFLLSASCIAFTQCFAAYEEDLDEDKAYEDDEAYEYVGYSSDDMMQRSKNTNQPPMNNTRYQQDHQKDEEAKFTPGINTAARPPLTDACNIWLKAEAICWQAAEDNLMYALYLSPPTENLADPLRLSFDWDWGFRVGAGYDIPRDGWDLALDWVHIENHAHGKKHAKGSRVPAQVWADSRTFTGQLAGPTTFGEGHWNVHLDQVDLQLGREFYVGRHLTFRPYMGLRTAFIYQKMKLATTLTAGPDFGDNAVKLRNKFWGFGFAGGFDTDWKLGAGFSLYGNAGLSLLFGFFHVREMGQNLVNDVRMNGWRSDSSFRTEKPVFDLALGFKWFGKFCNDHFGLTLKAGYEYHLYVNQNQWQIPSGDSVLVPLPTPGDLGYQGVTLSGQFDF